MHFVSAAEHALTQLPPAHTVPELQRWPQPPQLRLSVCPFTHVALPASAPHKRSAPFGHTALHEPVTHASPAGHTVPHLPQLSLSLLVSTHAVPHTVWAVVHDTLVLSPPVAHAVAMATAIATTPNVSARLLTLSVYRYVVSKQPSNA
jgi:hypothetical protein